MTYDLWDVGTRFYFGRYEREDEGLRLVATLIDHHGEAYADDLELVVDEGGPDNLTGAALVERVRQLTGQEPANGRRGRREDEADAGGAEPLPKVAVGRDG